MREKSILGSAALYWSELTLWQKLMGGIAVSGLPATLSVITNSAFLMALAGVNAVTYGTASYLLDEFAADLNRTNNWDTSFKRHMFFESVSPTGRQTNDPIAPESESESELDSSSLSPVA